ncbi:MATE family efflux transporter [Demequina sp. TTPB684]|uniref:MATE family efflux transporter n=1 Tax=unclassified Demequina TaxID=2620311 RepID=UPI001CF13A76|nr:MATE family efflux transporter [Demequina sp. TMPB413]MCB2412019.1 MATE family efflux transporter [Demequina sp. TTPB684]UPU88814.1 MATE family efflux transporter [Demequina sp. TMPB413]
MARPLPHRKAAGLAVPAIASNIAVPLAGLVDTAVLGNFAGAVDIGAVGLGAAVIATLFWVFSFLRVGTTSLVGRAFGADDAIGAVRHVQRAIGLAGVMAVAWLALQWVVVPLVLAGLAPAGQERDTALEYTLIRGLSLPALLVTLVIAGYFIGAHNTRVPLAVATTTALANVGFDFLFVAGLGWGARGAGWGTFASEWIGVVLAAYLLWRHLDPEQRATLRDWRDRTLRVGWARLARFNGTLMARTALLMGVITFVASVGSRFDTETLAANAIMLQLMHLASYALDGYANAAEALAARAAGRRSAPELNAAALASAIPMAVIALVATAAYLLARDPLLSVLTDLPAVNDTAREYWLYIALLPALSWASWWLDGVYLGAGRPGFMLASMSASVVLVFVPVLVIGARSGGLTNHHVWIAFLALNVARQITLAALYPRLVKTLA